MWTHRAMGCAILAMLILGGIRQANGQGIQDEPENVDLPRQLEFDTDPEPMFWRLVFSRDRTETLARSRLAAELDLEVVRLDRACSLTEDQRKKLLAAGRGDIKRLFDRIEQAIEQIRKFPKPNDKKEVINQFAIADRLGRPLEAALKGSLIQQKDSMYQKTLDTILDRDQQARRTAYALEMREREYHAIVGWTIMILDQRIGLSQEQRRRLEQLVLRETVPPVRFNRNNSFFTVLYQMAEIPEHEFESMLNPSQWAFLRTQLERARSMKVWLAQSGFVPGHKQARSPGLSSASKTTSTPRTEK
jgi:hypothetical protein